MLFGTREFMQEIRDPDVDPSYELAGWGEATPFLNGGLGVASSVAGHREYFFTWSNVTRDEARKITDYADGVYGVGPLYMFDPVAADRNVLPQSWATASLAGYDAIPWAGNTRPVLSAQADQSQGYPVEKATYTLVADTPLRSVFVPIPAGFSAWVGVHGDAGAAGRVKVTPFTGAVAGTKVNPTILSVSTTTRVNELVEGTGFELSLDVSSPGACPVVAVIAQILPDGVSPEPGGFISGQGNAGLKFLGRPVVVPNTVADGLELVTVSAKLGEVQRWS